MPHSILRVFLKSAQRGTRSLGEENHRGPLRCARCLIKRCPWIVDASVALAWALPDESSAYAEAVLAVVEKEGLRVPELWAR